MLINQNKKTIKYLSKITDDFGIWQHAKQDVILKKFGYALDDNARGLIVFLLYEKKKEAFVCLKYLQRSFQPFCPVGLFRDDRTSIKKSLSQDMLGLSFWALSFAKNKKFYSKVTIKLLSKIEKIIQKQTDKSVRFLAYLVIGWSLQKNKPMAKKNAILLLNKFNSEYNWFEKKLTYANSLLPLSLLYYIALNNQLNGLKKEISIFKKSLITLEKYSYIGAIPSPVGNRKWQIIKNIERDIYGQQPIDASFNVLMYQKAFYIFKEKQYFKKANQWYNWFLKDNIFKINLINKNGSCADGIDEHGISKNSGAESNIMFLWASHYIKKLNQRK